MSGSRQRPVVEITLDCAHVPTLAGFWSAALGYEILDSAEGQAYLSDPAGERPFLCLLEVPEAKSVKNRMHFDLVVTDEGDDDQTRWRRITDEVERLRVLGAVIRAEHPPRFVGMQDPEGNEFDVT
jgi:hypothetical protein